MEETLSMTNINDFLFCPRSLYYGNIFRRSLGQDGYQQTPQKTGLAAHETIDDGTYSTRKDVLTGIMVYCEKYGLLGRIDIYDGRTRTLTERKYSVSAIWEGFKMQLYAQCFALQEMGCEVASLRIHSRKDNKTCNIPLPNSPRILANIKVELANRFEKRFSQGDSVLVYQVPDNSCVAKFGYHIDDDLDLVIR